MTTDERLEKLEREVSRAKRRNRWLLTGAGLCLGIGLVAGALRGQVGTDRTHSARPVTVMPQPAGAALKEVRARKFVLEDENGRARAVLSVSEDGPGLALLDQKGQVAAELRVHNDGPRLGLYHEKGKAGAMVTAGKLGPQLGLFDEKGEPRAVLGVDKLGPELSLFDEKGQHRAMLSVEKEGPGLSVLDENGKACAGRGGGGRC